MSVPSDELCPSGMAQSLALTVWSEACRNVTADASCPSADLGLPWARALGIRGIGWMDGCENRLRKKAPIDGGSESTRQGTGRHLAGEESRASAELFCPTATSCDVGIIVYVWIHVKNVVLASGSG